VSRVLAVDWGTRRVGLAVSDPLGLLARPLPTAAVTGARDAVRAVCVAAAAEEAEIVLLGLPLHASGEEGESAFRVRRMGRSLETRGFSVIYRDERWTSQEADAFLAERGERDPAPGRRDQVAALLLLNAYLLETADGA
jgi:putative Holliday junction resolvase